MLRKISAIAILLFSLILFGLVWAYPPAVGITSKSKSCLACHASNGPWQDEKNTIIDIIDKKSKTSLKQPDGTFLISAHRGETKELLTVIGRKATDTKEPPYRNGWILVDPDRIEGNSLSKFASGCAGDLPAGCCLVGGALEGYEGANITALQFTLRPSDEARDAQLSWQIMLTKGESVKGKAKEGMTGNYYEKKVILRVVN